MHQVYDLDHDGFDELLVLFPKSYYVYSPLLDSVLFSDTVLGSSRFSGLLATQIGNDDSTEILIIDQQVLYLQDGAFAFERRPWVNLPYLTYDQYTPRATWMYLGDADQDGQKDLMAARLGWRYWISGCPMMNYGEENSGAVVSLGTQSWDVNWLDRSLNGEHTSYRDLTGDGSIEVVAWGRYYLLDWFYDYVHSGECIPFEATYMEFGICDAAGQTLVSATAPSVLTAVTGSFVTATPQDEVIVYMDGASFNPSVFTPSGQFAIYCLGVDDGPVELLWGRDATIHEQQMFQIESLPGTFCASTEGEQYALYSGSDGSVIGAVHGLTRGLTTEEGRFLPPSFEADIQLLQFSGHTVHLFQLLDPTDVDTPNPGNLPRTFGLVHNYPNPFNAGTTIEFTLDRRATVTLELYNLLGQRVATLLDQVSLAHGEHRAYWDARDSGGRPASSGVYVSRLAAPTGQAVHKLLLLK
jgi:hypothetical protein